MKTRPNDPVSPIPDPVMASDYAGNPHGLSKRELFAAHALAGLLANPVFLPQVAKATNEAAVAVAQLAVECADAVIARLGPK